MKKYSIFIIIFFIGISTIYAFSMDTTKFSFTNETEEDFTAIFDSEYALSYKVELEYQGLLEEVTTVSKNITYLLLKKEGSKEETALEYNHRYKQYLTFRYEPDIPTVNGAYDTNSQEYSDELVSSFVVPNMFRYLDELDITYTNISSVRVFSMDDIVMSAVYIPSITMKQQNPNNLLEYQTVNTNLVLYYMFKKYKGEYKIYYLSGEVSSSLSEYFTTIENKEFPKSLAIAPSYKADDEFQKIYNYKKLDTVSNTQKQNILNKNANSIVMLNSYYNNNLVASAHGFFLKKGILITTWSYLEKSLQESQYFIIKDYQGNFYNLDGIVTVNKDANLAVLKLKEEVGSPVTLSSNMLNIEDPVFMISSKVGTGYVLQSGIHTAKSKSYQNLLPLVESDAGSPLLDINGEVVGMNTNTSINTSISAATPKEAILEVLEKLENKEFQKIPVQTFDTLKEKYYYRVFEEDTIQNTIPDKIWKKYSKIGDIENAITLKLVKSSYQDGIVSLRYLNEASDYLSNIQFSNTFRKNLKEEGYEEVSRGKNRYVYQNENYKIIIKDQFHYLVIVMVKI